MMVRTVSTSRPHRFLARERELDRLRRPLEAAAGGRGGVVIVSGPLGIGVTTFAHEVDSRASSAGMDVLWGRCVEGTLGRPFSGLADALEAFALQLTPGTVQADLGADAGPITRICPRLSPLVPTMAPLVPLDPADERLRLYEAVIAWLRRMSARRPLLVVIDDVRDISGDLVSLLAHVAPRIRDLPVLLLVGGAVPGLRRAALEALVLEGLDEGATATLVAQVANEPVGPRVAHLIHEASAGNPLFAIELYRHLVEERQIDGEGSLPRLGSLPDNLVDVVAWRAAHLTGESRASLDTVACFADGAQAPMIATISGLSRARGVVGLEAGLAAGLLELDAERGVYVIAQPAIRAAVVSLIAPGHKLQLHRRIALAIEDEWRERLRESAGELTHHYAASASLDGRERGVNSALLAAEQARAAFAHQRAEACLEVALELAPEGDRALRIDLLARLAMAKAAAGLRREALATARELLEHGSLGAAIPADVLTGITDTLRALRGAGGPDKDMAAVEEVRVASLARGARADTLVRARLEMLGEGWRAVRTAEIPTLVWSATEPAAARTLLASGTETDGAEVMLAQRARTHVETVQAAEFARAWRRPQSVLRAQRCLVTDLVTRHGLFREGAARALEYASTAARYGAHRDQAAALLLLTRARAALGDFAAADEAIADALEAMAPIADPAELTDELTLARLALAHYRDTNWLDFTAVTRKRPTAAGLVLASQRALAETRLEHETEARALVPSILDAVAQQAPLTLYRDTALVTVLSAAWELGAGEHAVTGRSLTDLAIESGARGQIEGTLAHTRARMFALATDLPAARAIFAAERPALDRAGLRPLRAILDHDEAVAIAAASKQGYVEAMSLFEAAVAQFEQLGMVGWLQRTRSLIATGLEAASAPGGRLSFTYPMGLSRREADVVRLIAGGASDAEAATALVVEPVVVERLLSSALDKLGATHREELPRLARRYGLGGG